MLFIGIEDGHGKALIDATAFRSMIFSVEGGKLGLDFEHALPPEQAAEYLPNLAKKVISLFAPPQNEAESKHVAILFLHTREEVAAFLGPVKPRIIRPDYGQGRQ